MLRWTVRTLGGSARLSQLASRPSTSWFSCAYATQSRDALHSSSSAIDALRQYLSPENAASDRPLVYSPSRLRSLYYRAESRNQLEMLDSKMLTFLIGVFGSLSIDPCISVVYNVSVASRLLKVSGKRKTYWPFVLKVGRYKSERGMLLQDSDRFWLMCAELACIQAPERNTYSAILRARLHYHIIRRHSRRPEVHAYFLEALLAIRDPRLLDFVARDLSFLLRTHRICHPRLQCLLHRLVLQHGESLSNRSQEAILSALWSRMHPETEAVSQIPLLNMASDDHDMDAVSLARSISTALLGFTDELPDKESATPFGHLFSVFSPAYSLSLRWNSLLLLSVFNSLEPLHFARMQWTGDHVMPQVTLCWRVIFGLAVLDKMTQEPLLAHSGQQINTEGVLETTSALYQLWLPIMKSGLVSQDLACTVAISFLRIASVLGDAALFYDCQGLYLCLVEELSDDTRTSMQRLLAAQYLAAAARVHGAPGDMVLAALESFSADVELQCQVIVRAVRALAPVDPSLAYKLYTTAQNRGTEPGSEVTLTLAVSFVQHGLLRPATVFLNQGLSLEERGILISAIARSFNENTRIHPPQSVLVAIVNELAELYKSNVPPEHFRGHLERLFVVLAQHGRGRQLLTLILSIFKRSPGFFRARFFVRYCHALIRHRQFAIVNKLLDAITVMHPKIVQSLAVLTNRITTETRASLRGPSSLRISSRLRRRSHAGLPLAQSLQGLLKSGRILAAKHIFARVAATVPSKKCTTLGNILLHGVSCQPTPRNERRVRKVLALMENLVKNHGFQPDRVTVNILIKVMIGWRSAFSSTRLRELFDQLVRGGYSAADYSPRHLPFGTSQVPFSGSTSLSKLSTSISFEKHSRPLFKMFIKAFYLCNDVEAARRVVGILKVEEHRNAHVKKARQRARSRGRIRADGKNVHR